MPMAREGEERPQGQGGSEVGTLGQPTTEAGGEDSVIPTVSKADRTNSMDHGIVFRGVHTATNSYRN